MTTIIDRTPTCNATCTPTETHAGHIAHTEAWADAREIRAMAVDDTASGHPAAMIAVIGARMDTI